MRKLGVKTSRYANTDLYTVNPIDAEGNGTIKLEGLKYGFERGVQFNKLDVPKEWLKTHRGSCETGKADVYCRDSSDGLG